MIVIIEKLNSLDDRTAFTPASPCNCTLSGYVICSSMSCGLRPIQSANTITWFSDRSGIASTGVCSTAYSPQTATPAQAMSTIHRLRTENSMIRAIMCAHSVDVRRCGGRGRRRDRQRVQTILRVHQERPDGDDPIPRLQPALHRVTVVARARPDLHLAHVVNPFARFDV